MKEQDAAAEKEQDRRAPALKVTDRRHFTAEGQPRSSAAEETEEPPKAFPETPDPPRKETSAGFDRRPVEEPPDVSFTMLINAMAQPALLFLGEIPHPETGQPLVDAEKAKLQIDMLQLLQVKCRGNLTPQEGTLLDQVLYQLRMLFVARVGPGR